MKECKKCNIRKDIKYFYKHPKMKDGRDSKCKDCAKKLNKISSYREKRICKHCDSEFITCIGEINRGRGKYCSNDCGSKVRLKGIDHPYWKGEDVTMGTLHDWVKINKGEPSLCDKCGTTTAKVYDWANISQEYKRDLNDFMRLCRSCHAKYDWETSPRRIEHRRVLTQVNKQVCDKCGFIAKNKRGLLTHKIFKHK